MCTLAHVYVVGPTQNDQRSHDIQKIDAKVLNFILNSYLTNEKVGSRPEIQTKMAGRVKSPGWISHVRESHVRAQRLLTHVKSKRHVRVFV